MSLYLTPRGGLSHPVFSGAGPGDQVLAAFAFHPALDDAQLANVQRALADWSESAPREESEEPVHCDEPFLCDRTLRIRVHNLREPRAALEQLQERLAAAGALREGHFSRWRAIQGREEPAAVLDPQAPEELTQFPSHADYLRAVFDAASPPPASEYEGFGRAAFETRAGDIVLEDRGVPLHLPPLRLCYGTARASFRPPDARTGELRDALSSALSGGFAPLGVKAPQFFSHDGKLGELDRVEIAGRVGYGFGIASTELIQRLSNTRFRYREHELFDALTGVIAGKGLAPVVTWQRFGKPFAKSWKSVEMHVAQLWET